MPKADKLEHSKRVETVRQLILSGTEAARIVQSTSIEWKVTERQVWNYIRAARAQIQQSTLPSREYLLAEHISVRRSIRERARKAGDLRAELAAVQDEAKMFGLYAPDRLEVDDLREKTDSDLVNEFQSILDAARARASVSDSG